MRKKLIYLFLLTLSVTAFFFYIARSREKMTSTHGKLQITTSFYPLFYFASQIAGDRATVTNITPTGVEPHDYEPTTGNIIQMQESDLLIINGGVELWADKIKETLKDKKTIVLEAGSDLSGGDPHIWLDPTLAKKEAEAIYGELIKIDPKNEMYYHTNETNLLTKLDQLDQSYKQDLAGCQKTSFVTSHAAFGHLANRYGLTQVAIANLSPDVEPSLGALASVANFVKANNIKYVFFESLVSPKLSQTIAKETGAETLVLDPLEGLTQNEIDAGQNFFTIMQQNLQNLRLALECS